MDRSLTCHSNKETQTAPGRQNTGKIQQGHAQLNQGENAPRTNLNETPPMVHAKRSQQLRDLGKSNQGKPKNTPASY